MSFFTILNVIYAAFKTWYHTKRNACNVLSVATLLWFIVYCFAAIGNALLLISTSACIYTFLFYKGQTVLDVFLPDEHVEKIIKVATLIAFVGKV